MAARKPVQSFETGDATTDAEVLAQATGEDATTVCPSTAGTRWRWPRPWPPTCSADPRSPWPTCIDEITWPDGVEVGLVETAGGCARPWPADDGDAVALAAALMPDVVVLVADAGLGTINASGSAWPPWTRSLETRDDPSWWWCSTASTPTTTCTAATWPGWPTTTASTPSPPSTTW